MTTRITFNTGRGYSADGQIIHVEFTAHPEQGSQARDLDMVEGWLKFYDETRGLYGKYNTLIDADYNGAVDESDIRRTLIVLYDSTTANRQNITFEEAEELKNG